MRQAFVRVVMFLVVAMPFVFTTSGQSADEISPETTMRKAVSDGGVPVFDESGVRVVFDRATGKLRRFTTDEVRTLNLTFRDLYNASGKGLIVRQDESGTMSIVLNQDFLDYTIVQIGADGQLITSCVKGEHAAHAALRTHAACSAPAEEK